MESLPGYIAVIFILTSLVTVFFFYKASHGSKAVVMIIAGWLLLQSIVSFSGFYSVTNTIPPRFMMLVLPPLLLIIFMFATERGRGFVDALDQRWLLLLHTIRIPVEIVLFLLFVNKTIPQIMTFEGKNWDIISGISAPLVYWLCFVKRTAGKNVLLFWNIACLLLLINIVVIAILSAPFVFQRLAFDQPNIALLYFPYTWLPCCVVPLVLFSHLAAIRQLLRGRQQVPVIS